MKTKKKHKKTLAQKIYRYRLTILTIILIATLLILPNQCSSLTGWLRNPTTKASQMLLVRANNWDSTTGIMQRYARETADDEWQKIGDPIEVSLGENGLAWGRGLHGFHLTSGPIITEGAKKSPAGVFQLVLAFGKDSNEKLGVKLPYKQITKTLFCPDDPKSKFYNKLVDTKEISKDWNSAEDMNKYSEAGLYTYGVFIDHNAKKIIPGAGSCFFIHAYQDKNKPTFGCTAMTTNSIKEIVLWLDPTKKPILVQLPDKIFGIFKPFWHLPI